MSTLLVSERMALVARSPVTTCVEDGFIALNE